MFTVVARLREHTAFPHRLREHEICRVTFSPYHYLPIICMTSTNILNRIIGKFVVILIIKSLSATITHVTFRVYIE